MYNDWIIHFRPETPNKPIELVMYLISNMNRYMTYLTIADINFL